MVLTLDHLLYWYRKQLQPSWASRFNRLPHTHITIDWLINKQANVVKTPGEEAACQLVRLLKMARKSHRFHQAYSPNMTLPTLDEALLRKLADYAVSRTQPVRFRAFAMKWQKRLERALQAKTSADR